MPQISSINTNLKITFPTINTIYNLLRTQYEKIQISTILNVLPSIKHMKDKLEEN
jgi:Fe2+ or Zn2+ uptake regulation protein